MYYWNKMYLLLKVSGYFTKHFWKWLCCRNIWSLCLLASAFPWYIFFFFYKNLQNQTNAPDSGVFSVTSDNSKMYVWKSVWVKNLKKKKFVYRNMKESQRRNKNARLYVQMKFACEHLNYLSLLITLTASGSIASW